MSSFYRMSSLINLAVFALNQDRASRVRLAIAKMENPPQTAIAQHVGFDFNSGLGIAQTPDGGVVNYLPLNYRQPPDQISIIVSNGITRGDWQ